ncbi:hypothetical protein AB6A40_002704 [Gnathostoma spinigerum]|uniref:Uncharacterized protein n=1 Tax=Gnathostoma spinigerum TaxID=75299 RepID=A0ABD6E7B6_9BILA
MSSVISLLSLLFVLNLVLVSADLRTKSGKQTDHKNRKLRANERSAEDRKVDEIDEETFPDDWGRYGHGRRTEHEKEIIWDTGIVKQKPGNNYIATERHRDALDDIWYSVPRIDSRIDPRIIPRVVLYRDLYETDCDSGADGQWNCLPRRPPSWNIRRIFRDWDTPRESRYDLW